jgi:hypothetical protein
LFPLSVVVAALGTRGGAGRWFLFGINSLLWGGALYILFKALARWLRVEPNRPNQAMQLTAVSFAIYV